MIERLNKKFPFTRTFPKEVLESMIFKVAADNGKPLQNRLWTLHCYIK